MSNLVTRSAKFSAYCDMLADATADLRQRIAVARLFPDGSWERRTLYYSALDEFVRVSRITRRLNGFKSHGVLTHNHECHEAYSMSLGR